MGWETAFFIIAIIVGILGIWNLARQRAVFLSLAGILWFLIVLFERYIRSVYTYRLAEGVPEMGRLFLYVVLPVFLVIAFFTTGNRR